MAAAGLAGIVLGGIALAQEAGTPPVGPAPNGIPVAPGPAASAAQLEGLAAPIALDPDPLLAQILMAATYPLEVVEAARWVDAATAAALSGTALAEALAAQNWDPSVKALVAFPRVLANMSGELQWTEALGEAFLAQPSAVLGAVQSLRKKALAAGNLAATPQCHCVIQTSGDTISILPAEPQALAAPAYGPEIYGPWPASDYPPETFPPPDASGGTPGFWLGFGPPVDLAIFGPLWGWSWIDWGHRVIAIGRHRLALACRCRAAFAHRVWVHDPARRGPVGDAGIVGKARAEAARLLARHLAAARARPPGGAMSNIGAPNRAAPVLRPAEQLRVAVLRGAAPALRDTPAAHRAPPIETGARVFPAHSAWRGAPMPRQGAAPHLALAGLRGGAVGVAGFRPH